MSTQSKSQSKSQSHPIIKNINKNYIYTFIANLSITDAIWMLYLAYRGMDLVQIGLLESLFHITGLTMEIPTGIVADRFGRKTSRVLGRFIGILATFSMLNAHSFLGFALAFILSALGHNLESGAGDALIYDSLIQGDQTHRYMKIKGFSEVCFQSARVLSLVIGGWVATFSYELGYTIALAINVLAFLWSLTFKEPQVNSPVNANTPPEANSPPEANTFWGHIWGSIRVIKNHRHILNYVLFLESFSFFQTTLYFYAQNFFKSQGYTEAIIGLILAASALASIAFSLQAHRFEGHFGRKKIVATATGATLLSLAGMAFLPLEALYFLIMACIDGVLFVTFSDYINQLIPSNHRATLLSFEAMVFSTFMIIGFPIFGFLARTFSFKFAFFALFILAIPSMGLNFLALIRTINQNTTPPSEV